MEQNDKKKVEDKPEEDKSAEAVLGTIEDLEALKRYRENESEENKKAEAESAEKEKEQTKYNRRISKERNTIEILCLNREIDFKKKELEGEIIETRMLNQIPGQPAILIDGYKDSIKPEFLISNEIDKLNQRKKEFEEAIENIKEKEEEDARETTKP